MKVLRPVALERDGNVVEWSVPCPRCAARIRSDVFEIIAACPECDEEVAVDLGWLLAYGTS